MGPFGPLLGTKRGDGVRHRATFCLLGPKLAQVAPPDPLQDPFWDDFLTLLGTFFVVFQQVFVFFAVCFAYLSCCVIQLNNKEKAKDDAQEAGHGWAGGVTRSV